jgi:hypothetical protein
MSFLNPSAKVTYLNDPVNGPTIRDLRSTSNIETSEARETDFIKISTGNNVHWQGMSFLNSSRVVFFCANPLRMGTASHTFELLDFH